MKEQSSPLLAFPAPTIPDIHITGTIARRNNVLFLQHFLLGNTTEIDLPSPSGFPSRKHELWKATCFEFFLAITDQPQYWEFNLSPSGDWNIYHMDAYRRIGFREETSIQRLPFEAQRSTGQFTLNVAVDLSPILRPTDSLDVGITAVIHTKDGNETYWALTHPAPQADFHLRKGFILALAGQTHPLGQAAPGD
jgi:hypothetical protein